jgi:hypothetical protein
MGAFEESMSTSEPTIVLVPKPDRRGSLLQEMSDEWTRTPEMRLSLADAQHRWHLESSTASELLNVLVDLKVLTRADDGTFVAA